MEVYSCFEASPDGEDRGVSWFFFFKQRVYSSSLALSCIQLWNPSGWGWGEACSDTLFWTAEINFSLFLLAFYSLLPAIDFTGNEVGRGVKGGVTSKAREKPYW